MITSTFDFEKKFFEDGYEIVIGIDEVGRGPLAGPVVACAVAPRNYESIISNDSPSPVASTRHPLPKGEEDLEKFNLIRDSKMLSEKQRESLFDFIHENFYVGVGICDHLTIDRVNILEASFLAMKKAVSDLNNNIKKCHSRVGGNPVNEPKDSRLDSRFPTSSVGGHGNDKIKTIILVDGNKAIPNISIEQKSIIGGDKIVKSISAASIIAKVTRDRMMNEMDKIYPEYGFSKHKGYGTAMHVKALDSFGPCEIHRRSFKPVRIRLGKMRKN